MPAQLTTIRKASGLVLVAVDAYTDSVVEVPLTVEDAQYLVRVASDVFELAERRAYAESVQADTQRQLAEFVLSKVQRRQTCESSTAEGDARDNNPTNNDPKEPQ